MQRDSSIQAICGGDSAPWTGFNACTGLPRSAASAAMVEAPPGGHWLISAVPPRLPRRRAASGIAATRALRLGQQLVNTRRDVRRELVLMLFDAHAGCRARVGDNTNMSSRRVRGQHHASEVPKRILRGSKFATTTMRRPTTAA